MIKKAVHTTIFKSIENLQENCFHSSVRFIFVLNCIIEYNYWSTAIRKM